jgi:hypothetical protein
MINQGLATTNYNMDMVLLDVLCSLWKQKYGSLFWIFLSNEPHGNEQKHHQDTTTRHWLRPASAIARHLESRFILATGHVNHIICQKAKYVYQLGWCHLVGLHFTIDSKQKHLSSPRVTIMHSIGLHRRLSFGFWILGSWR